MSEVTARVVFRKGTCKTHKVGDKFVMGEETPPNVCSSAFHSLFPFAEIPFCGDSFPREQDPNKGMIGWPDPENGVVSELRRTSPQDTTASRLRPRLEQMYIA